MRSRDQRPPAPEPNASTVAVVGAGVIGRVLAANLALGGVDVTLVARGITLDRIGKKGVRLRSKGSEQAVPVKVAKPEQVPAADVVFLCLRANSLPEALPTIEAMGNPVVVPMMHLGGQLGLLEGRFGHERIVSAFPGLGGFIGADGVVEWLELGAKQPTTVDGATAQADLVLDVLRRTALPLAATHDMESWMATHVVFVAGIAVGIVRAGGDAAALARNIPLLRECVLGIRSGLAAIKAHGLSVQPRPIEVLFTKMPAWFAVGYWRRALPGPVGKITMAPQVWNTRFDELPLLWHEATELAVGPAGAAFRELIESGRQSLAT